MIGAEIKDAYQGQIRTGTVVEDLGTHWRVDWGPNRTKIRKDRVGKRPKRQGPWWPNPPAPKTSECRSVTREDVEGIRDRLRDSLSTGEASGHAVVRAIGELDTLAHILARSTEQESITQGQRIEAARIAVERDLQEWKSIREGSPLEVRSKGFLVAAAINGLEKILQSLGGATEEKSIGGDFDVPPAMPADGDWSKLPVLTRGDIDRIVEED
jgi:hypothetical protein